jgi:hypothetical protein
MAAEGGGEGDMEALLRRLFRLNGEEK